MGYFCHSNTPVNPISNFVFQPRLCSWIIKSLSPSHNFFLYVQHLKLVTAIIYLKVIITYFKRELKRLIVTKVPHFSFIFSALLLKKMLETVNIYW